MPHQTINGDSFFYDERGQGVPLVLLHGFPLDHRIWDAQVAGLSDELRVIAPDLRGFGQSRSDRAFTLVDLADDVHQLLTRINALPCILAGLSMGGYVQFAFLTRYLKDLRGLIFVDTKPEADPPEAKENRLKMAEAARTKGAKAVADMMEPKMLSPKADPAVRQSLRAIMESQPPKTLEHALLAMRERPDHRDKLPSIACPALIVVGDSDAFIPRSLAESMNREIHHSRLEIIPDAGHLPCMEQPQRLNEVIRDFLHHMP